jgi:hypothetical protein
MEKITFHYINGTYKAIYHQSPEGEALSRFLQDNIDRRNFRIFDRFIKKIVKETAMVGRKVILEHIDNGNINLLLDPYSNNPKTYTVAGTLLSTVVWQWAQALSKKPHGIEMNIDWDNESVTTEFQQ